MYAVIISSTDINGATRRTVHAEDYSRPTVHTTDTIVTVYEHGQPKIIVRNWNCIKYDDFYEKPRGAEVIPEAPPNPPSSGTEIPF